MDAAVKIGFSMHPRWLGDADLETFVRPLRQAGLGALEFELDHNQPYWAEFEILMQTAARQGLDLSFHAPYRAPYSLVGFAGPRREAIAADYRPMLAIADRWGERLGSLRTVVVHAAVSRQPAQRADLEEDTRAFLLWALENFPHIRLALENNSPARENELKVGDRLEGVLSMIAAVSDARLQACWDMGHDYLSRGNAAPPDEWLSQVVHVHVHDVNEQGADHFPLVYQRVPWPAWMGALRRSGMSGLLVLELKGGNLAGWSPQEVSAGLVHSVEATAQAWQ
ncbi:MAG: TIM barrel protein [Anaerolineaceae bacterium]|nr:TIM barrel protein [Anaerolineaceae bacterium]